MAKIPLILLLSVSLKKTRIKITMRYDFIPVSFAKYGKIDSVMDTNSIEINLVKSIKIETCTYPLMAEL